MRAKRGHALFHAIVTMGAASVQACGGVTVDSSHAGDGQRSGALNGGGRATPGADTGGAATSAGTSGGDGNPTSSPFPSASGDGGSFGYVDAGSAGAVGIGGTDPLDGGSPSMCAHPEQLQCTTWYPTPQGCSCNTSAPLSAADCAHTEQFTCMSWDPTPQGCSCNTSAPLSAADCAGSNQKLYCHSYTPQVGCYCTCVICIH